jgi:hypothetical protein
MITWLVQIQAIHEKFSLREKLLALLFLLAAAIIWGQNFGQRAMQCKSAWQAAQVELASQQHWLEHSESYSARLSQALARVDPAKTYSSAQLSGQVDTLLRAAMLSDQADIDPVRSREGEIFNDHHLRVRLNRISIAQMVKINTLLKAEQPYINLVKVQLTANRSKPHQLDARLQINSFDLKAPAL